MGSRSRDRCRSKTCKFLGLDIDYVEHWGGSRTLPRWQMLVVQQAGHSLACWSGNVTRAYPTSSQGLGRAMFPNTKCYRALMWHCSAGGECGISHEERFHMPLPGGQGKFWYSFDFGPIHFLQYSTEQPFDEGSEQYRCVHLRQPHVPTVLFLSSSVPLRCSGLHAPCIDLTSTSHF